MPIPDGVPTEAGALAETLSVTVRALRRARTDPGNRVAVVGAGAVGLMALQAALALGASSVLVVERLAERRRLAEELGAELAPERTGGHRGRRRSGGRGERPGGRGRDPRPAEGRPGRAVGDPPPTREPPTAGADLEGSRGRRGSLSHVYDEDFRTALTLLGRGSVRAEPVISDRIPLERALVDGLQALAEAPQKHLKIVVTPDRVEAA